MPLTDWTAVEIVNPAGRAPVVLVCEHASATIPMEFDGLGLEQAARLSHAAWDIGADLLARRLSNLLDAPLVAGMVSRLVYDCNRPQTAPDCIAARSEVFEVPGNRDLDEAARADRHDRVHEPFHAALAETLHRQDARCGKPVALVTIHSFTPTYLGVSREVEIGYLHHADPALACSALAVEIGRGRYRAALDEPYSASDGVTWTLARHGTGKGRPAVMVEIRNDLLASVESAMRMGGHLSETLVQALAALASGTPAGAAP